jgi:hypothetical protein
MRRQYDRSHPVPGSDQPVGFQLGVRGADGIDVHPELARKSAHGWKAITGLERAVGDEEGDPRANLGGEPDVRAWVELQR